MQRKTLTPADVNTFERLAGSLAGMYSETQALAKKKANETLNAFKIGIINNVIQRINEFLGDGNLPIEGFVAFDTETLPSASDVLFVLSQYGEALEHLRAQHIKLQFGAWYWVIDGDLSEIRTAPPKKIDG